MITPDANAVERIALEFRLVFEVPGRYVNDHCVFRHNGRFHLFYIDGEVGKGCYTPGNEVIIGHAESPDLLHWERREPALTAVPFGPKWEEAHIFAPFVWQDSGTFYMFYSGDMDSKAQSLGLATSTDLIRWQRCVHNPVFRPSRSWALWSPDRPCSGRDPHLIYTPQYGYILYYVADMAAPPNHAAIGCAFSDNLFSWQDGGPVLIKHNSNLEALHCKTESPFVLERNGLWYLFYRHGNGTKYAVSDTPLDWRGRDTFELGPCHASELIQWGEDWFVTSCSRPLDDPAHRQGRTRGLYLARLHWDGWRPVIGA